MTLVELMVAMAVTSIILVGLGAVLYNVSPRYQGWVDRLNNASTGTGLAASLQADSHRYVVCDPLQQHLQQLDLCPADDLGHPVVSYRISSGAPYVITRQPLGQSAQFMARSAGTTQPDFWADCLVNDAGNAVSGHIHVYHLRLDDGAGGTGGTTNSENFSVYYAAPWRSGCL